MLIIAGDKSGACVNPAVGVTQTVWYITNFGADTRSNHYFSVYTLGPWTGALLAGIMHRGHLKAFATMNTGGSKRSKLFGDAPVKSLAGGMAAAEERML